MTGAGLHTICGFKSPIIHIISPRVTYLYHRTVTASGQRSRERATAQDGLGCTICLAPGLGYSACRNRLSTPPPSTLRSIQPAPGKTGAVRTDRRTPSPKKPLEGGGFLRKR